ncbi:hypothetical protein GCK72_009713 [Caenorhabditis remanei]|uniref:Uncharacterized protein n=1 Tax=Caenorhabditis remanei TaxID=31234 RepID=A0A6A5H2N4_CAERE|nr:hypothetical protein GCK72_009713 [Caenorhabditis remanei]KAF1761457.1 hypothetical protein GCK72_009713 [Caenorhabditis remanei]
MPRLFNTIWNTLRQCIGFQGPQVVDDQEHYQPIIQRPPSQQSRSTSPNSISESVSISVRSSGSESSHEGWKELEELRKGSHRAYIRDISIENPSLTSEDSGYESAAAI